MITEDQILDIIKEHLPAFEAGSELQSISGGNLNYLWRLEGRPYNLIIKWAPPHIAANPEVPLSPERIHFEARALDLFSDGHLLDSLATKEARPPALLHFEPERDLLIMEDLGPKPPIADWIRDGGDISVGTRLGRFIGKLHRQTLDHPKLIKQFNNQDIQQTRLNLQYNPAADYLRKTGLSDVDPNLVSKKTKALGQQLLEPGRCLVMGDLWPPSVRVADGQLRVIDWEFAHFGRPLQDVGHFAAHCWMQAHQSASPDERNRFKHLWKRFWETYRQQWGSLFGELFTAEERDAMATHIGAEIWVRAAGPFKQGYVYGPLPTEHTSIRQALCKATECITAAEPDELWTDK